MNEKVRLLLQYIVDHGAGGIPINLEGALESAVIAGQIEERLLGNFVLHDVTEVGKHDLVSENSRLGNKATRLVRKLKTFGFGVGPVVYGWPFEVPMSAKTLKFDNCLVVPPVEE